MATKQTTKKKKKKKRTVARLVSEPQQRSLQLINIPPRAHDLQLMPGQFPYHPWTNWPRPVSMYPPTQLPMHMMNHVTYAPNVQPNIMVLPMPVGGAPGYYPPPTQFYLPMLTDPATSTRLPLPAITAEESDSDDSHEEPSKREGDKDTSVKFGEQGPLPPIRDTAPQGSDHKGTRGAANKHGGREGSLHQQLLHES